ncbi:MAG TPA: hypothetical protein HPP87_02035 [Planctomycetes bacterium]|nr:hypothetical protein [Planctomycetota bacterium]
MKYFIRTISLLVLLNLATVNCSAQKDTDMGEEVEHYRESLENQVEEQLSRDVREAQRAQVLLSMTDKPNITLKNFFTGSARSGTENILVIPSGDVDAQQLAETVEDMKIMSHIFQKELAEADMTPGGRSWVFFWRRNESSFRSIYLEGYGAVFLMEVDFPLLPVAQLTEEEVEEGTDPVWDQARRELTASEDDDIFDYDSDEEVEYDADKVTDLKSKLIRNLKHASNIRNLSDKESIIIAVTGSGRDSADIYIRTDYGGGGQGSRAGALSARGAGGRTGALDSQVGRPGGARGTPGGRGRGRVSLRAGDAEIEVSRTNIDRDAPTPLTSGNVLIMRAKKADVDAFAKGKLDFGKFQKRMQIFTY